MLRRLIARSERWPLSRPFRISRGEKIAAEVVTVELRAGDHIGCGEAVPYARYGESIETVLTQIASFADGFAKGAGRDQLQKGLPPGAARNAIDCALWDLEAKTSGRSVADFLGLPQPGPMVTAVTVSLDAPERMAAAAASIADAPLIKVKVDAEAPVAAVEAVRAAAPNARLIVDPNESWSPEQLVALLPAMEALDVALIEQPIAASDDAALEGLDPPAPICADEAAHTSADLERIARRYQAVNIKLDKTGGLTEALAMSRLVREMGLRLMVGCMVSTSLSVAPALVVAAGADFVDLDGPWWLLHDRDSAMRFNSGILTPPRDGWGIPLSRIA